MREGEVVFLLSLDANALAAAGSAWGGHASSSASSSSSSFSGARAGAGGGRAGLNYWAEEGREAEFRSYFGACEGRGRGIRI